MGHGQLEVWFSHLSVRTVILQLMIKPISADATRGRRVSSLTARGAKVGNHTIGGGAGNYQDSTLSKTAATSP